MSIEIKVPNLPESVADAVLQGWTKKVGDFVSEGENLASLETDKVVLDLPAPTSGYILALSVPVGTTVKSGTILGTINPASAPEKSASAPVAEVKSAPAPANIPAPAVNPEALQTPDEFKQLSPSARKQARLGGSSNRFEERVPMTRIRKRIAERLVEAQHTTAMLTTFNEVNMKPIMDLRKKYQDLFVKKHDVKLGFMSFFVKAAVEALKLYPAVNASIDGDDIIYHNFYDIGIAVSSPRGLVVPILRNAEALNLADVEKSIVDFAEKSKKGSLTLEDMTGGTFSITNGGTFGSMLSTPILNSPQSAILGMHNIVERPVVENGEIVIRPIMYLALTYDHRIIDGREAVGFLVAIKNIIEDPSRLLLNL